MGGNSASRPQQEDSGEWEIPPNEIAKHAFQFTYPEPLVKGADITSGRTLDDVEGQEALWEFFLPSDGSCSIANHYQMQAEIPIVGNYIHHMMTLMAWQTDERMHVIIAHYVNDYKAGVKAVACPRQSVIAGKVSLAQIVVQEITITKISDGDTIILCSTSDDTDEYKLAEKILEGRVSRVMNPYYPEPEARGERQAAINRLLCRIGEMQYSINAYNCQHLVTHILLGEPFSDQAESNILMATGINQLLTEVPNLAFRKVAKYVITSFFQLPTICSKCTSSSDFFHVLVGQVDDVWASFLGIAMKTGSEAMSASAAYKCAKCTGGMAAIVELVYNLIQTSHDIYCLRKQGTITPEQFVDNIFKRFAGSAGSIAGTVVGSVVGLYIPISFGLGIMFGSMIGGFVGRWLGVATQQAITHKTATGQNLKRMMIDYARRHERRVLA